MHKQAGKQGKLTQNCVSSQVITWDCMEEWGGNSPCAALGSGRLFSQMPAGKKIEVKQSGVARAVLGFPQHFPSAGHGRSLSPAGFEPQQQGALPPPPCARSNWAFNQPNCCLSSQAGGPGGLLNTACVLEKHPPVFLPVHAGSYLLHSSLLSVTQKRAPLCRPDPNSPY